MTYFPQNTKLRPAIPPSARVPVRPAMLRDVLWGRPLFKAPTLPNPRLALDPLPFTATRITHRSQ